MRPSPVLPGSVIWSGENSIISLKDDAQGLETTNVTLFRVVYSPFGTGHAVFVSSREFYRLPAGYTDNAALGAWLRDELLPGFPHYSGKTTRSIELRDATFTRSGDPRHEWCERIVGNDVVLELTWSELGEPFIVDNPGGSTGQAPYHVIALFVPAGRAQLTIDGKTAGGRPFPRDIAGTPSSTCFLALSETWLT
jgi:hypothetical protein